MASSRGVRGISKDDMMTGGGGFKMAQKRMTSLMHSSLSALLIKTLLLCIKNVQFIFCLPCIIIIISNFLPDHPPNLWIVVKLCLLEFKPQKRNNSVAWQEDWHGCRNKVKQARHGRISSGRKHFWELLMVQVQPEVYTYLMYTHMVIVLAGIK